MSDRTKDTTYFLLGAALGLVVGYFLNSDKMDEMLRDLKGKAQKIKDELEQQVEKGKDIINTLVSKSEETIDNF